MCNVVQLCLAAYNILLMHAYMKPRISPSCDRSCVKMADRFQSVSLFIKKKTRLSNDKAVIDFGYRKRSWFVSGRIYTRDELSVQTDYSSQIDNSFLV